MEFWELHSHGALRKSKVPIRRRRTFWSLSFNKVAMLTVYMAVPNMLRQAAMELIRTTQLFNSQHPIVVQRSLTVNWLYMEVKKHHGRQLNNAGNEPCCQWPLPMPCICVVLSFRFKKKKNVSFFFLLFFRLYSFFFLFLKEFFFEGILVLLSLFPLRTLFSLFLFQWVLY